MTAYQSMYAAFINASMYVGMTISGKSNWGIQIPRSRNEIRKLGVRKIRGKLGEAFVLQLTEIGC